MARYEITAPDGSRYEVSAPDGASQDEVMRYAQSQWKQSAADWKPSPPTEGMGSIETLRAGIGQGMANIVRAGGQILGLQDQKSIDEARKLDAALSETTMGKVGNVIGSAALALPTAFIPGANTVTGAALVGAGMGALQPTSEGESRLANAAIGGALGGATQFGLGKLAQRAASKLTEAEQRAALQQAQNASRDATLKMAREAGYVVPPSQAGAGATGRALEGLAGKITTAQSASAKNQAVTNALVKADLGFAPDEAITKDAIVALRKEAGGVYETLRKAGTMSADDQYLRDVAGLGKGYQDLIAEFPELANAQVDNLMKALAKPSMSSNSAVELTKKLRFDGFKNTVNIDPEKAALGRAQLAASDAIEGLMERNLEKMGNPDLLQKFREARVKIAKAHTAEAILNPETGDFSARALGALSKKNKPLSGGMEKVAQFSRAFPKATQDVEKIGSMSGLSPLDYFGGLVGGGLGAVTGNPMLAALPLLRPATRAGLLSGPYQQAFVKPQAYGPTAAERLSPEVLAMLERLGGGLLGGSVYSAQ